MYVFDRFQIDGDKAVNIFFIIIFGVEEGVKGVNIFGRDLLEDPWECGKEEIDRKGEE